MRKQSMNRLMTTPTINQIISGEIKNPDEIRVTTLMAAFRGELGHLKLSTHWKIDYTDKELQYIGGLLRLPIIVEPILPFQVPESHLRTARKLTAAVFGAQRFRGVVRMYEKYHGDTLYYVTHKDKRILMTDPEDAKLWGVENDCISPKVQKVSLDVVTNLYPGYSLQDVIVMAQRNSLALKVVPMRYQIQKIACKSADEKLDQIKQTGYSLATISLLIRQLLVNIRS
ncbi:MAG: hypothetical protein ACTSWQ_10020 [Candidatus Thorarchaeota archaeon]